MAPGLNNDALDWTRGFTGVDVNDNSGAPGSGSSAGQTAAGAIRSAGGKADGLAAEGAVQLLDKGLPLADKVENVGDKVGSMAGGAAVGLYQGAKWMEDNLNGGAESPVGWTMRQMGDGIENAGEAVNDATDSISKGIRHGVNEGVKDLMDAGTAAENFANDAAKTVQDTVDNFDPSQAVNAMGDGAAVGADTAAAADAGAAGAADPGGGSSQPPDGGAEAADPGANNGGDPASAPATAEETSPPSGASDSSGGGGAGGGTDSGGAAAQPDGT